MATLTVSCLLLLASATTILAVSVVVTDDHKTKLCDTMLETGGWTVIQRRVKGQLNFYRGWADYKTGFSDEYGDFWYGLEMIHRLTTLHSHELYVSFDYKGKSYYAHYKHFMVMSEKENYRMYVSGYSGNAGDSLIYHNGAMFSTKDRDHDTSASRHCAQMFKGAWWYVDCHRSNLNGEWDNTVFGEGLNWKTATTHTGSAINVIMMVRSIV